MALDAKDVFSMRSVILAAALAALSFSCGSCNKSPPTATTAPTKTAEKAVQSTFATAADAGAALRTAADTGDKGALLAIFGPDGEAILFSGDAAKDSDRLRDFVAAYDQMHRWREIAVGGEMLYVGADNFLFPIPLGKNSSGQWQFDTAAGKDEILARRIGRSELLAIAACSAIVKAQQQYFSRAHDGDSVKHYAQKLEELDDGGGPVAGPQPFEGYYFRVLTRQGDHAKGGTRDYVVNNKMTGGFAVLAYPAAYRDSGIMTFIVASDGIVYQKDLGENTTTLSQSSIEYDPGDGWSPVT